uniref:Copper transport protein n=1 Tax=Saccoglossus kowalevskii TaxID=10224 RepID=A0ABM0MMF2_SACKO|nr:PREDICTED: uncharacterized protein LOC102809573 [Saccoglossus kowalevskii]
MLTPPEIADPTLNKSLSIAMGLNRWKTYDVILKTLSKDNGTEGMEHGSGKVSKDRTSCNMRGKINKQRLKIHVVQTILHITQLIMSYVTMLLVMNYNIWLLVSVAVSGGIGYFVFASEDTGYRRLRARPPVVV